MSGNQICSSIDTTSMHKILKEHKNDFKQVKFLWVSHLGFEKDCCDFDSKLQKNIYLGHSTSDKQSISKQIVQLKIKKKP